MRLAQHPANNAPGLVQLVLAYRNSKKGKNDRFSDRRRKERTLIPPWMGLHTLRPPNPAQQNIDIFDQTFVDT